MIDKPPKIMILYASYGDGHLRASKAVETCFHSKGIKDVVLLDLLAEAHPMLNELTKFIYLSSFKVLPAVYGAAYEITKDLPPKASFLRALNFFGTGKLKEALHLHEPDLVIHTFPQMTLPGMIKKTGRSLPLVNIITDFDVHARWLHPEIDRYYVATEDMKREMINRGVSGDRILASGIPLRPDFCHQPEETAEFRIKLNPDKKTVLLMAGAYGVMQGNRDICRTLLEKGDYQILAVCGRNRELYKDLESRFGEYPDFHLFGFVQEVSLLMQASDCIITKPGGITLSEALACRLPIFLYRPVPGQELNNARYLRNKGIAFIAEDAPSLCQGIDTLLLDEDRLSLVRAEMENLRRPEAAEVIVNDILEKWFGSETRKAPVEIGSDRPRLVIH